MIKTLGQVYLRNHFGAKSRCALRPVLSVYFKPVLLSIDTCSNFEIIIIIFERETIGSGTTKAASPLHFKNSYIFIVKLCKLNTITGKKKKKRKNRFYL